MTSQTSNYLKTISEYHRFNELPKPQHPLISVIKFEDIKRVPRVGTTSIINNFYTVALKNNFKGKLKYGQQDMDFDEGVLHFMSPKQVLTFEVKENEILKHSGWLLLIHPDFLWNTSLATKVKQYEYFN